MRQHSTPQGRQFEPMEVSHNTSSAAYAVVKASRMTDAAHQQPNRSRNVERHLLDGQGGHCRWWQGVGCVADFGLGVRCFFGFSQFEQLLRLGPTPKLSTYHDVPSSPKHAMKRPLDQPEVLPSPKRAKPLPEVIGGDRPFYRFLLIWKDKDGNTHEVPARCLLDGKHLIRHFQAICGHCQPHSGDLARRWEELLLGPEQEAAFLRIEILFHEDNTPTMRHFDVDLPDSSDFALNVGGFASLAFGLPGLISFAVGFLGFASTSPPPP
jgi:hypothetical protein